MTTRKGKGMRHIIIGNGIAGITAASELARREAGEIHVYTDEPHPYYFRPQLPRFLAGDLPQERLTARSASWYEEQGLQVHLGSPVTRLIPEKKQISSGPFSETVRSPS